MARAKKQPQGTLIEKGAAFAEEFLFVSAIAVDLADCHARRLYADWLEERGDDRADFVRRLASALENLSPATVLPHAENLSQAWLNMQGYSLLQGIMKHDLTEAAAAVLRVARPVVTIETQRVKDEQIPLGASKFGGNPDLPESTGWPACEKGPLGFLCQFNLKDLQFTQVSHGLPQDGLLAFFAYQDVDEGYQPGVYEEVAGDMQVIYTPSEASLVRRDPRRQFDENWDDEALGPFPACEVILRETWDLPGGGDKMPNEFAADMKLLQEEKRDYKLHEIRSEVCGFGHHLLGYSLHFRTDDPTPGLEWPHLLCLDSDDNLWWSWCDGEHLAVYVHEEDLKNQSFSRVYGYAS